MIDFKAIASRALAIADSLLAQWLPDGRRDGHEWKARNPTRSDSKIGSFSINIVTGAWADFATGDKGGDLVALYAYLFTDGDQGKAAKELADIFGLNHNASPGENRAYIPSTQAAPKVSDVPKKRTLWAPVLPAPHENLIPIAHPKRGTPEKVWTYRDFDGRLLGVVYRFRTSDGGKEVLPLCWARHETSGQEMWRWMAFPEPRPLYGLNRLTAKPDATLLIVEGEKCADVANEHLPELASLSWPGGGKAVVKANWAVLQERRVKKAIIWPDCDAQLYKDTQVLLPENEQPGMAAAGKIAEQLLSIGFKVWIVDIPKPGEKPSGWDIADATEEGLTGDRLAEYVRTKARQLSSVYTYSSSAVDRHLSATRAGAGKEEEGPKLLWRKGEIVACLANIRDILASSPEWNGVVAFNEFSQRTVKLRPPPFDAGQAGEWDATDDSKTAIALTRSHALTPSSAMVAEAIEVLARENTFHPVRDWLRSLLKWDGVPRTEEWLSDYVGADRTPYTMCVGRFYLTAMVARVMRPGVKFDYCLVLEGLQGKGKSSVFAILGGEWYGDTDLDLQNKDSMSSLVGKWCYEFPELGALAKSESTRQKSFLSRQADDFRPVYGRRNVRCLRQTVFGGTTNEWEWNKDPTGGRRFWPVEVKGEINLEGLKSARDQLFAEALHLFESGERFWPTAEQQKTLFDPEQIKIEQPESLVDALHDWVYSQVSAFSIATAVMDGLKLDASKLTRDLTTRVGIALRKLGCTKVERRNGMVRYWYEPPQKSAWSTTTSPAQPESGEDVHVPF
jgi:predicted P-loop ATPase